MRVHQIINSFSENRGGAERIARRLHLGLLDRGVDAHLVAIEDCETAGLAAARSFGLGSAYDLRALPLLGRYVRANVGEEDIVHAHLFPTSAYVATLSMLGAIKGSCVFTEHNTWNRRRSHAFGPLLDRFVYGRYLRLFAISKGTCIELIDARPYLGDRVEVVENGAELHFRTMPERTPKTVPTILAMGRLTPQKNFATLLEALARLPAESFQCIVLGEGELREQLEAQAFFLGLEASVAFKGHVPDVHAYLQDADIFVIPSLWEGFGLAVVEAMNAGLPVVASNVPGLSEIVGTEGDCAKLIDPRNPDSIAAALGALIATPDLRYQLGFRGFARAKQFSTRRMVANYVTSYETLSGEHIARA
ncbi:MAG: glycosyltransferase [Pseudomonadota bacterium]